MVFRWPIEIDGLPGVPFLKMVIFHGYGFLFIYLFIDLFIYIWFIYYHNWLVYIICVLLFQ